MGIHRQEVSYCLLHKYHNFMISCLNYQFLMGWVLVTIILSSLSTEPGTEKVLDQSQFPCVALPGSTSLGACVFCDPDAKISPSIGRLCNYFQVARVAGEKERNK